MPAPVPAPVPAVSTLEGEAKLVRELLFVMQNIEGSHVRWQPGSLSSGSNLGSTAVCGVPVGGVPVCGVPVCGVPIGGCFALSDGFAATTGTRQIVARLAELGWLYRQVNEYVHAAHDDERADGARSVSAGEVTARGARSESALGRAARGLVPQALAHALQAELGEWHELLAVLEAQRRSELSLQQLLVWTYEPLQHLITLTQLVRGCRTLKGGAMTRALERYERHGDVTLARSVRMLKQRACAPLYLMLRRWLSSGELRDPHGEFFVEERETSLEAMWEQRYQLREAMLPCFVDAALAKQVLRVGKTINFVRFACADTQWAVSLPKQGPLARAEEGARLGESAASAARTEGASEPPGGVAAFYSGLAQAEHHAQLQSCVHAAAAAANRRLVELLTDKFALRRHCEHLKLYLLLGQGDFVHYLVEHLGAQLSRPAEELHRHQLLSLLEGAVRSCLSASRASADAEQLLLDHLNVQLLRTPGASGWDAFSLDYAAPAPINVVLSAAAMAQYRQLFTFLWKVKRVEHSLTKVWRKHTTAARLIRTLHADPLLHGCHCLRNEMVHFVCNLQYYLMFEVVECSWSQLMERFDAADELDELIAAHADFLGGIVQKALLGPENLEVLATLRALFETILHFSKAQDHLYECVLQQQASRRRQQAEADANAREGLWGASGSRAASSLLERGLPSEFLPDEFREELGELAAQYREQFTHLFLQVRRHSSLDLAFLSFRLDANHYYESLLKGEI